LIDWLKFKNAPLSIDFSPSGEFLATSHLNSKAVYLWSNRTFFSNTIVQKVPRVPTEIDLPDLSTTELKKRSHSEFYNNEEVVAEPLQ
jgi:WD40 repeat protein